MEPITFTIPPGFWKGKEPAIFHFRRASPGTVVRVHEDEMDDFLRGMGEMPATDRWVELAELRLVSTVVGKQLQIRPRLNAFRCPVTDDGLLDRAALDAIQALPEEERRARLGWEPVESEHRVMKASIENLGMPFDLGLLFAAALPR